MFLGEASIVSAEVYFPVLTGEKIFVSSEGASIVQNFAGAYIYVLASVRANDAK
ncbi:MAG: hypothetical protein WDO15_16180 [Bacteroidota bacterium]